jgi:hypothetical protein
MKWEVKVHRRRALVHIGDAVDRGRIAIAVRHHRAELLHLSQPIVDIFGREAIVFLQKIIEALSQYQWS